MTLQTPTRQHTLHFRQWTSDGHVIEQVFGAWDYDFTRLNRWGELRHLLETQHRDGRRPLIIDAGANIGASTVFFSAAFPTSTVVAIEPEGSNFDLLCKNTEGLNVRCIKAALTSEPGHALVTDPGDGHWSFRTQRLQSGDGVPCVTVNSVYDQFLEPEFYPFIVKMDIEGGEEDLFRRNTEWVDKTPIVIVELHDWMLPKKGTSRPFLQCVSALERDFIFSGANVFSVATPRYDC